MNLFDVYDVAIDCRVHDNAVEQRVQVEREHDRVAKQIEDSSDAVQSVRHRLPWVQVFHIPDYFMLLGNSIHVLCSLYHFTSVWSLQLYVLGTRIVFWNAQSGLATVTAFVQQVEPECAANAEHKEQH